MNEYNMDLNKMKPCPFCGTFPAIYENRSESTFTIECLNFMCRLHVKTYVSETEEAAIELWNTRAEEPLEPKTAHWDINCDGYHPYCSNCKKEPQGGKLSPYCPNCGAKMMTRGDDT